MATIDLSIIPALVTVTNTSARVKSVQHFKTNLVQALEAGDVLKITATSSAELFYWLAKADTELTVVAEAITEA